MKVSASVLASDFSNLQKELSKMESAGVDAVHLDVMDGHFVPNLTFGAPVIAAMRPRTRLPFDVHLMVSDALRYIEDFARAGADIITVHAEAEKNLARTLAKIRMCKCKVGLAIKPETPVESVLTHLGSLDLLLVMTVEPGFGGQKFMPEMLKKVQMAKAVAKRKMLRVEISVDGGINPETAALATEAGASMCVAGTAIFAAETMSRAVADLKSGKEI